MSQPTAESLKAQDARIAELSAQGKDVSALKQKREEDAAALKTAGGSLNPLATDTPKKKAIADEAHADADALSGKGDAAKKPADAKPEVDADKDGDDTPETDGQGKPKKGKGGWGKILGGLVGVGGAWFISSMFGGGWLGTLLFALFAIPGFMIGREQMGNFFGSFMGEAPSAPSKAASPGLSPGQAVDMSGQVAATAVGVTPPATPGEKIHKQVAELTEKTEVMSFVLQQQAASGRVEPRRMKRMVDTLNEVHTVMGGMNQVNMAALTPEQAQMLDRTLKTADRSLDRLIAADPIVSVQVMQQIEALRAQRLAQEQAQPLAVLPPQGPVFAGAPTTTYIGAALPPDAQRAVADMRGSGQYYQYQPAPTGYYETPRFGGQPDMPPYAAAPSYYK